MNTGGGNRALHYSDLNSPSNVSSAEMPKDNGRGHVALCYSHESDHSTEIKMDSSGGNICDPKEGDTFLDPVAEMQMNTGGGNRALHYSDLNSPSNVSSAEMPKDNGRGHVALCYSHLYSHESDHSAEIQMDSGGGNICDPKEGDTFLDPTAEMQLNTGGGNRALHYSDLNSPSNVSSAEMPKDNGCGHVALRYSHLYSHESDHSAEIQMDSGGGNICDPKEGDTFLDPAAEYTESNSESESSSREDSICDTQEQMI